ncbi:hypothetical protein Hanom_Chr02g00145391 [Helianthus anomalus]
MSFLPSLMSNLNIDQMNWCGYLLDCLNKTKQKRSGLEWYNGPLMLPALIDAHDKGEKVKKGLPASYHYNTKLRDKLENDLITEGDCFMRLLTAGMFTYTVAHVIYTLNVGC